MKQLLIGMVMALAVCVSCAIRKNEERTAVPLRVSQAELACKPDEVRGFGSVSFLKKNDVSVLQDGAIYYGEDEEGTYVQVSKK
jgi:hypothetical protein